MNLPQPAAASHRFCVAPMMEWTDRHCRFFHRLLTKRARLYTEMVTADAVLHGSRERVLAFSPAERPLALQLGGSNPKKLAEAAAAGEDSGYDEINLNVGCPSERVQEGRFGACLMREPQTVADCVAAMKARVSLPISVKCRTGVDDLDQEEALHAFVETVAAAGCRIFIIHARKAWLSGLSPRDNREIPPLDYGKVIRLKKAHPELTIVLNGGLESPAAAATHLADVDGVMLGRAVYRHPYLLAEVDRIFFGGNAPPVSREEVLLALEPYIAAHLARGGRLNNVTRHILGLYHGQPRGKQFRRLLSEAGGRPEAGPGLYHKVWETVAPKAAGVRSLSPA